MRKILAAVVTCALLALGAVAGVAATSAQQVYQQPEALGTAAAAPPIPTAPGTTITGTVAAGGAEPRGGGPEAVGTDVEVAAVEGGTLPVTGFDALLILAAAGVAGAVGLGLRKGTCR